MKQGGVDVNQLLQLSREQQPVMGVQKEQVTKKGMKHSIRNIHSTSLVCSVLPRYLKACRSNMPFFLKLNIICMKNMPAVIELKIYV